MENDNLYSKIASKLREVDEFLNLNVYDQIAAIAIPAVKKQLTELSVSSAIDFERIVFREYIKAHNAYRAVSAA
jgi:predicted nucleotide-binding protein (sugar kinase/HSP70/actin superfamily)